MESSQVNQVFGVSDFIAVFNQTIEYAYPIVAIEGEVASFKVNQNKYVFFDIKDSSGSIGCFMSVWQLRMPIEDGMKVVLTATPKLTNWGKFSLTVKSIKPSGEGSIKKSFEILKEKLSKEGLFDEDRKRRLPQVPSHIAVISSTQAAGYADFIKIINDRWAGLKVDVGHVQVQGETAPDQIIRAIEYFNSQQKLPEVLVIIRGGGSADDLSVFNDEKLVRTIAASRIPTLVGVGHEVDETLAGLSADVRAATPSNAAQIVVPDKKSVISGINNQINQIPSKLIMAINQYSQRTSTIIVGALDRMTMMIDTKLADINYSKNLVYQFNPELVLKRGYSIIRGNQKIGSLIDIETDKLLIKAEVKDVRKK